MGFGSPPSCQPETPPSEQLLSDSGTGARVVFPGPWEMKNENNVVIFCNTEYQIKDLFLFGDCLFSFLELKCCFFDEVLVRSGGSYFLRPYLAK